MERIGLQRVCCDLMAEASVVYVTSIDNGDCPHIRAMFNLRNSSLFPRQAAFLRALGEDLAIYLSTNTSSIKVAQFRANPVASLYYCIPEDFRGCMMQGRIALVADPTIKRALWQSGWERYYPAGEKDPDYAVLQLRPERVRGWYRSQSFEQNLR